MSPTGKSPIPIESITPDVARRALYIDFEGRGRTPAGIPLPLLLGVVQGTKHFGYVLDRKVALLARSRRGLGGRQLDLTCASLDDAMLVLAERCRSEGRLMIHYSFHESKVIKAHCDPDVARACRPLLFNGKLLIQEWYRRRHRRRLANRRLADVLALFGYDVPLPDVRPADTVQSVNRAARRVRLWSQLPAGKQDEWRRLLEYNRQDCVGLAKLCKRGAKYLHSSPPNRGVSRAGVMPTLPTLTYRQEDRESFHSGRLRDEWGEQYRGILFEQLNLTNATHQPGRHFVEWFTAVQFHRAFGYHALYHRQARNKERRERIQPILGRYAGLMEYLTQKEPHCGKQVMFPDVFLFAPDDLDDWLMVECKGPKDRVWPHQKCQNARIESLSGRPVLLLNLAPSPTADEDFETWVEAVAEIRRAIVHGK